MDEIMSNYAAFKRQVCEGLRSHYGETPDEKVLHRLKRELDIIKACGLSNHFIACCEFAAFLKSRSIPYIPTGVTSSAFVFFLLGASSANPLPPHYHCPNCHSFMWDDSCKDGFDLPPRRCACGRDYARDGHDIPMESYWRISLFKKGEEPFLNLFSALVSKDARQIMVDYLTSHPLQDVFTPVEYYDADPNAYESGRLHLHFADDFPGESADFFEHMPPDRMKQLLLEQLEHTETTDTDNENDSVLRFNAGDILDAKYIPNTFYGLMKVSGMYNSVTEWDKSVRNAILSSGAVTLDEFPAHRDEFYELLGSIMTREEIWKESERIRKGKGTSLKAAEHGNLKWLIDYVNGVRFLSSKSHSVEWLMAIAKLKFGKKFLH